jgi:hypothetical protein
MKLKPWSASACLEINIIGSTTSHTIDLASIRTYRRYKTCSHATGTGCIILEVAADSSISKKLGPKVLQPHMADTADVAVSVPVKPTAIVPGASLKEMRLREAPVLKEDGKRYMVIYLRTDDMAEYITGTNTAATVTVDDQGNDIAAAAVAAAVAAAAAAGSSGAYQDVSDDSSSQEEKRSMETVLLSALQSAAKEKLCITDMADSSDIDQQYCSALIKQRDEKAKAVPIRTSKRLKAQSSSSTTSKSADASETQDRIQLVYPTEKGAQDVITLTLTDYARLDEGEFLNDNIVDFFLKVKCVLNAYRHYIESM